MSSTSFANASIQFSYYVGLPIFGFGIIGNLINIAILFPTRSITCSFLLFISSIFNLIALLLGLFPRVLTIGFSIDPSSSSIFWCKSRLFISYTATTGSLACICLASVDRYFVTCRSVIQRNRSKLSTAKIAVFISSCVLLGINIPFLFFYTIVTVKTATGETTTKCALVNPTLMLYGNYFLRPFLLSIIPGVILITTGLLTYRNITSIAGIQLRGTFQRNLTSMILLQIIVIVIPIVPFATMNIYQTITSAVVKSSYRLAQETLASDITNMFLYISYAANFYIYLISASCYRQDFIRFICCSPRNHINNRIGTMTREQLEMNTNSLSKQLVRATNQVTSYRNNEK